MWSLRCRQFSAWRDFSYKQPKPNTCSPPGPRVTCHLAQFLAGSTVRCPSAPEAPGLDKHSQALLPTARPAGSGGLSGSPGPQVSGPQGHIPPRPGRWLPWEQWHAWRMGGKTPESRSWACIGLSPFSQMTFLPPSLLGPGALPLSGALPSHSHPRKAICHPRPLAGTTA